MFWILMTALASNPTGAFLPLLSNQCQLVTYPEPRSCNAGKQIYTIRPQSDSSNLYNPTTENIHEMEEVILSLCFDSDDTSRRRKLSQLMEDNLQNPDGGNTFIKLFDHVLIVVGDRMRLEANKAAIHMTQTDNSAILDNTPLPSFPLPAQEKSLTEGRLWACVDMMVQSKTLIKQAKLKLGNRKGFIVNPE
jgi:hypothetical protein